MNTIYHIINDNDRIIYTTNNQAEAEKVLHYIADIVGKKEIMKYYIDYFDIESAEEYIKKDKAERKIGINIKV